MFQSQRIFMKPIMFGIFVRILNFQILTLILYFFSPHKKFLPREPTAIASTIADVAGSRATQLANTSRSDTNKFRYDCFVGVYGEDCAGMEVAQKVRPLKYQ